MLTHHTLDELKAMKAEMKARHRAEIAPINARIEHLQALERHEKWRKRKRAVDTTPHPA